MPLKRVCLFSARRLFLPNPRVQEGVFAGKQSLQEIGHSRESFFAGEKVPAGARTQQGELLWIPYGSIWIPYGFIWIPYGSIWSHIIPYEPIWLVTGSCSVRLKQITSRKPFKPFPGFRDIVLSLKWTKIPPARFLGIISVTCPQAIRVRKFILNKVVTSYVF